MSQNTKLILCPHCHRWFPELTYDETEVPCDLCDTHPALSCPACDEPTDIILTTMKEKDA